MIKEILGTVSDIDKNYTLNILEATDKKVTYTINNGTRPHSRKIKKDNNKLYISQFGLEFNLSSLIGAIPAINPLNAIDGQSEFNINERFEFLENFANMVIYGVTSSLLICGEGGLGKSHVVMSQIEKDGLIEDEDFIVVKGYSTAKALYVTLFENKNKLIVFDDCDNILTDTVSLNILKGAIDSYHKRTVSWLAKGFIDDGYPDKFDFEGSVIFISNKQLSKIDGAVKSRTLSIDLSMTTDDKMDRMRKIVADILPDYKLDDKKEVLEFIDEHKNEAKTLNLRLFEQLIKVQASYNNDDWKKAAKYLLIQA